MGTVGTATSQIGQPMTNTLRSRIATALAEAQEAHNGLSDLELADAVIRELKLLDLVKKLEADWTFIPGPDYPAEGVADD